MAYESDSGTHSRSSRHIQQVNVLYLLWCFGELLVVVGSSAYQVTASSDRMYGACTQITSSPPNSD